MRSSLVPLRASRFRAAAFIFAAMVITACSDNPAAPIPTAVGRVTVSATGDPVPGASVSIGAITATTDPDGRFELAGLVEGPAKIRGTATGFDPFEADIAVPSGTITHDIGMKRIELFESGDFTLHISETVSRVRGVLVALGGPNTRAFASGGVFGAPLPQVEASLQTLGQQMRAMAASRGLAILGTSRAAMPNTAASDQAIIEAIQQAASASGRADLSAAPFLLYALSGGAPEASGFTVRNASRVAGLFLKVPLSFDQVTSGPALDVPAYVVLAEVDAFINNGAIKTAYSANRAAGAPWA
ncbi:MAG: carboxypeptidase-like regulatory domain-containing protein, partial [Gemmatimonadaceae bacterium]